MKRRIIITKEILWILRDMAELIPQPFETKYDHIRRLKGYKSDKVDRALTKLVSDGLVKKFKNKSKISYSITDLGRVKSIKYAYSKKGKKQKINGLLSIVIFDIAEEKRKARDFLRKFLIDNGFTMLQRGVFIAPWEIHAEFIELLKELKIQSYVSLIEGKIIRSNL
jgi:DNA-binding transcriptional regulator PaaX